MQVSNHAKKRMKERCGANKKSTDRIARNAFEKGLTHKEITGKLCKWVDGIYLKHHKGNQIRLYQDKAFLFHNEALITVIPIPRNLLHLVNDAFKKRKEVNKMEEKHVCSCSHNRLRIGDIVKHFKHEGLADTDTRYMYKILNIGYDQQENKQVVYQALYGPDYRVWIRSFNEFMGLVDKEKYPDIMQEHTFELVFRPHD